MARLAIYHLETLLAIARLGTFRAAADWLNISQPTISARIREIEAQVGVDLFRRDGRGVVLTARGRQLVKAWQPLLAMFEQAVIDTADYAGATGVVRIGTGEIAAATCLPDFVGTVSRELPGVTLEIELDLTARMLQHLLAGTRDLVFFAGPVSCPGVRTAPIGSVDLVWLASPQTLAAGGFDRPLPVWSVGEHSPIHQVTQQSLAGHGIKPATQNTCNNIAAMIQIVVDGSGAAVFPKTMVTRQLASGHLVEILPPPAHQLIFEVAISTKTTDPLISELFDRASVLKIQRP